jgi:hypothetical protein
MNKKVAFLFVLLECILAVFIVSFFGHAIEDARRQILCQDIYFTYENGERIEDGTMIEYTLSDTTIEYQLYYKMETDKTSNRDVVFESSKPDKVAVDNLGKVIFFEETSVIITVRAMDGSLKMASIALIPKT